jgi:enamine deaminase RidA (YjgF/YER057c/UK114 family)
MFLKFSAQINIFVSGIQIIFLGYFLLNTHKFEIQIIFNGEIMFEAKLKELNYEIPEAPKPLAAYIPATKDGDTIYTAGQLPMKNGELQFKGKVGAEVSEENGIKAAEICAINCLSVIKSEIGSLDNLSRIVKVTVFVASADGFTAQPKIANGASEFLVKIFGDAGKHVRSAVGVSELPLAAPVEIEMIAKVK